MSGSVRLVLSFHNHQPVGNFDGVFEQAYRDAYLPFLDVMQDYPEIRFALHTSGSLLEWLELHRPEYVERLKSLAASGQVEIIGGAFYEPILANIPRRDRIAQIQSYSQHLRTLFGQAVRGMWLPERVWEQQFASDIAAAGIQYTIIDDYHFRCAGMPQSELYRHYVTEDEGRTLFVFPDSERLRYLIPFSKPMEVIDYLREAATQHKDPVLVFGDDGEKFGSWPETKKHVYEDRWLRDFLDLLLANRDWIHVTTPGEVIDSVAPAGRCYLPDASYREMTEWVLPPETQREFVSLTRQHPENAEWQKLVRFTRGGYWRNFRTRYSESHEMYSRMIGISNRLSRLAAADSGDAQRRTLLQAARTHLHRSQCNCSYWHGAFGGLYLPHLRNAVYAELIRAENLLEQCVRGDSAWVDVEVGDLNMDARPEVRLSNHRLSATFAPACGGHMYELDLRTNAVNLLATLNRRPEPYHQRILDYVASAGIASGDELAAISRDVRFRQPNLDQRIQYDRWPRKSLVDHFFRPQLSLAEFQRGEGLIGDFATGEWEAGVRKGERRILLEMHRNGRAGELTGEVRKTVAISADRPSELLVQYELLGFPAGMPLHFGVELNFAAMPGGAADRYFYDEEGSRRGTLDTVQNLPSGERLSLVDEWLGVDVSVESSVRAGFWAYPLETISQSEDGFEAIHQSVCVVPHWEFLMPEGGRWVVELRLVPDTAMAVARQLAESARRRREDQSGQSTVSVSSGFSG
ncbi:MAG: alpha-amylase/4-alpha-glucanotransferase domain-containing protein [Planctomycetaceae bacterium]